MAKCRACDNKVYGARPFCDPCRSFRSMAVAYVRTPKGCAGCGVRMHFCIHGKRRFCDECRLVRERRHNGYADPYAPSLYSIEHDNDNAPASKTCSACECDLPLSDFAKHKTGANGVSSCCRDCTSATRGDRSGEYAAVIERRHGVEYIDYIELRDDIKAKQRIKSKRLRKIERYRKIQLMNIRSIDKEIRFYLKNFEKEKAKRDAYLNKIASRPWLKDGLRAYERFKIRRELDLDFKIRTLISRRLSDQTRLRKRGRCAEAAKSVRNAIKGVGSVPKYLGYNSDDLKSHLENMFVDGMNWPAFIRGEIHIDHKTPLSHFDLNDNDSVRRAWSLENLQPLWAKDNIDKGSKTDDEWRAAA